jgi:hypothetical protein
MKKLASVKIGGKTTTISFKENNGYCAKFILTRNKSKLVGELHIPVGEWFGEWEDFDKGFFTETELYHRKWNGKTEFDSITNDIVEILNENYSHYITEYQLPNGITAYEFVKNNQ